jgi:hypothetical protein
MTDQQPLSPHPGDNQNDAWIERLLASHAAAAAYIEDDGFSARVLAQLPPRTVRSRTQWVVPLMSVVALLVGLGLLSGGENLSTRLAELARFDSLSIRALLAVILPLAVLYWLAVGAAVQQD